MELFVKICLKIKKNIFESLLKDIDYPKSSNFSIMLHDA